MKVALAGRDRCRERTYSLVGDATVCAHLFDGALTPSSIAAGRAYDAATFNAPNPAATSAARNYLPVFLSGVPLCELTTINYAGADDLTVSKH
jgi:hypothetical protein